MLYELLSYLAHHFWSPLRAFQYLSLRLICSILTALIFMLITGPKFIKYLQRQQIGQFVRDDGPQSHFSKRGTPTMGGLLVIIAIIFTTLLWANLTNPLVWIVITATFGFGAVGFIDDYRKVVRKQSLGLRAKEKYTLLSLLGLLYAGILYWIASTPQETALLIPYMKDVSIPLGLFFVVLSYFVMVGSSNAVNVTDGLDGLAIMPAVIITAALGVFAYLSSNINFSTYLSLPYIKNAGEIVIICGAIVGAGLGFLWFNTYPAQMFMGDTGSLSLGATLAIIAIIVRQELVYFIMSGLFVLETVSVIIQVGSYKLRKKRVFLMAPIHHHFESQHCPEPRITIRFWIMTIILVLIGLSSIKLR